MDRVENEKEYMMNGRSSRVGVLFFSFFSFFFSSPFKSSLDVKGKVNIWVNIVVFLVYIIYQKSLNFENHKYT